ncbi:MAG: hypothetical protein KDC95_14190 [Planctomycetes bacterium]|nr:hypothetical protein [Planctomycetota bacterium]
MRTKLSTLFALTTAAALATTIESAALVAQSSTVIPPSCATRDGNRHMTVYFAENRVRRVQVLIDARHLSGLSGSRLVRMSFRKDIKGADMYGRIRGNETTPMVVNASFTDAKADMPSAIFRDNHGSKVVEIFRGGLALPRVSPTDGRAVATFASTEAPTFVFKQPLDIVAGKTLCLDFESFPASAGHEWEWPIDAETHRVAGTSRVIGSACWNSKSTPVTTVMESSLRPGMHLKSTSRTPPNTAAAFLMYGLSDQFAFGTVPLPLTIAAPACQLVVSPDVFVPAIFFHRLRASDEGHTSQIVPTPQIAAMYGSTLYLQYLFLVSGATPSLATGNGIAAKFTSDTPTLGVSLVATTNTTGSSGRVFLDFAPVIELESR